MYKEKSVKSKFCQRIRIFSYFSPPRDRISRAIKKEIQKKYYYKINLHNSLSHVIFCSRALKDNILELASHSEQQLFRLMKSSCHL